MSPSAEAQRERIVYIPDCSSRKIEDVLAIIMKWTDRNAQNVLHLRAHPRRELRGFVAVMGQYRHAPIREKETPILGVALHTPVRNISQGGLGLIAPPMFVPQLVSDSTPLIKTVDFFREGAKLTFSLDREGAAPLVIDGTVVRLLPT